MHWQRRVNMQYVKLTEAEKASHPSIHCTGSVRGMKKLRYWGQHDHIVRCGSVFLRAEGMPEML